MTHYELCPAWDRGVCICAQLWDEAKDCDECAWSRKTHAGYSCGRHRKRTDTKWIPMGSRYWVEHEALFGEVRRHRHRLAQQREERQLMKKFRQPFEGRRFDADLRRC